MDICKEPLENDMHDTNGTFIPERSAASEAKQAAGMTLDDGKLALASDLYALDESEITENDPRLEALLADFGL